jgi:DNA-binding response OmpR family regulator
MSHPEPKILLVEDDTLLSTALTQELRGNHYAIDLASDGQTGLDLATTVEYDLILLDVNVPKLDGVRLCRQLRSQNYHKPILLLTAKDSDADIVAGLDAGADDYISKPCNPEVLLARIRTLLRRSVAVATQYQTQKPSTQLTWGNLCLDSYSGRVSVNQTIIPLTATEYNLLELFLRNPERIFSRSAILDRLWEFDDPPTDRAIITHIKDLRKKLKNGGLTEEMIETIYGMGYRLNPAPQPANSTQKGNSKEQSHLKVKAEISKLLDNFRGVISEQIAILEQAKIALLTGTLDPELKQSATLEAHKLAGSLATFGYPNGSNLARMIEHLLSHDCPLTSAEITQFSEQVTALRQEFNQPPITVTTVTSSPLPATSRYRVLVIDDDRSFTQPLRAEAKAWGLSLQIAPDLKAARSYLRVSRPDAILLDLNFPKTEEDGLTLLQELKDQCFPITSTSTTSVPIIVLTIRDNFADRLAVSRLGAKQFLPKPATSEQIFRSLLRVLPQPQTVEPKILVVDDDLTILAQLSTLLRPWGLNVTTLTEPQRFWEVLNQTQPELVILDLEMPIVSGLELCQMVRQDSQWENLPILVLTAHQDIESLQNTFAAGADDFINKPILDQELVTRVISRIGRTYSRHR